MQSHLNGDGPRGQESSQNPPDDPPVLKFTRRVKKKYGDNSFPVRRDYFSVMSKLDALFVQDLAEAIGHGTPDPDGFFECPDATFERMRWDVKEARDRVLSLRRKTFVTTQRRGYPQVLWVRIEYARIERAIDRVEGLS